jgi:hypothetical protein
MAANDISMTLVAIMLTEGAACVEKTARFPELYNRWLIRLRVETFFILWCAGRVAAERILGSIDRVEYRR